MIDLGYVGKAIVDGVEESISMFQHGNVVYARWGRSGDCFFEKTVDHKCSNNELLEFVEHIDEYNEIPYEDRDTRCEEIKKYGLRRYTFYQNVLRPLQERSKKNKEETD